MNKQPLTPASRGCGLGIAGRLAPLLLLLPAAPAAASSAGGTMPWDGPLNALVEDLQGPLVASALIAAVIVGCLLLAFGDFATGGKRIVLTVIAGSIALGVLRFFSALGLVGALLR